MSRGSGGYDRRVWKHRGGTKLNVLQGSTFSRSWDVLDTSGEPEDLTLSGWSAKMQLRKRLEDSAVLHELSSVAGNLSLTVDGQITATISAGTSTAWTFRRAVWSLEVTDPSGNVSRLDAGTLCVSPEVTR